MSTAIFDNFQSPGNQPANFPFGIRVGDGNSMDMVNNIGVAGQIGFGVGICPGPLPQGMSPMPGYNMQSSENYGNYQFSDGSIMVWIPAFYYKYGNGSNGLSLNIASIKPFSSYQTAGAANADGYALHRAFYDGGNVTYGFFVDKYIASNNSGIASSIKNAVVLSSGQRGTLAGSVYSALNGSPANTYAGSIAAAKTRGQQFFPSSMFQKYALALLALAHGQSATSKINCGWYDQTGVTSFPKGNNNNALGDAQDLAVQYVYDGNGTYLGCGKTGSANLFDRTTHNGQNCGVADLNGLVWEYSPGMTSDGTNLYILNTSVSMKSVTGGNSSSTDLYGNTGISAMYTNLGQTYQSLTKANGWVQYGNSSNPVLSSAVTGFDWNAFGAGVALTGGTGGTNLFGNDGRYQPAAWPNEMAPLLGGSWDNSSLAGVWSSGFNYVRLYSSASVGFRSALYL